MIVIFGTVVVCICVFGGFAIGGGHLEALLHFNELMISALCLMSMACTQSSLSVYQAPHEHGPTSVSHGSRPPL